MSIKQQLSIIAAIVFSVAGWAGASVIERPAPLPGATLSLTVSDLHGFIDRVGSMAAQVSPMASGMMIKSMLGMQLGDPGLSGIAPGKGLAIVAFDPTNVFAVVEVSEAKAPAYSAVLSQRGMQSVFTNGVLVIGAAAAQIELGSAQAAAVKQNLLSRRSPTLSMVAQPASLIAENSEEVEGMIATMPVMMGMGMAQSPGMDLAAMESMSRILEGEVRVLLSLAKQCEIFELVLEPKDSGLRVNETLVPAAGTRLAALLNAPKVTTSNPKVQSCMLADAAIAIDCTLANPQALTDFFCEEIELVLKEMDVESEAIAGMTDAMKQWAGLYNGSFSESVDFGGDSFINLAYALDIKSEADVISMFKSIEQDMAGLLEIYKSFGVPMTIAFKENVREHHEANIHHFKVNMTMPAEDAAAAAEMNLDFSNLVYEVAVCDGLLLVAMGETKVETLIDRVKTADFKAAPLKARGVYPADAVFYCDVDVARYMEGISSIMPADPSNPMPQMAAMLKGADPVTSAGFRENGMVMWSVNVPGSLLAKFGQAAMAVQMQQIQQMKNMQQMPAQPPQTFEVPMAPGAMPSGLEAVPLP